MDSFVSFDLETTGFNPISDEIIQIGAYKFKQGVLMDKYVTFVKPIQYIPREVQNITKITPEMVAPYPSIDEVLPEFFEFCEDLPFLGHNLPFDYGFVVYHGKRMGLDFSLRGTRNGIDTLALSKKFYPNLPKHTLEYLIDYFKIFGGNSNFHNAEFDAYMTKLLYDRFLCDTRTVVGSRLPHSLTDKKTKYGRVECNDTLSFE